MANERLAHSYFAKVRIVCGLSSREVMWSDVVLAADADEAKDLAIMHFADKVLPEFPGYRVGGPFEVRANVASDAGMSS